MRRGSLLVLCIMLMGVGCASLFSSKRPCFAGIHFQDLDMFFFLSLKFNYDSRYDAQNETGSI